MTTRRHFFKNTSLALATPFIQPASGWLFENERQKNTLLQTGIAGYTFRHFSIAESITMMQRLQVTDVTLKDFHLPLDSSPEKIQEILSTFQKAGITVYGLGVIYMRSREEVDAAFAYARKAAVPVIVGVPTYELLDYTEQKVKDYNIKMAIHNHGPEDKLYPGPKDVYDRIKNMDSRMGLCLDIGHAVRAGADPSGAVLDYAPRIFDLHIKDVTAARQDAKVTEVGRGIIDFPTFIKALYKIKYTGRCSFEYEKDMKDPLPGMAESIGYFKGVMKTVNA